VASLFPHKCLLARNDEPLKSALSEADGMADTATQTDMGIGLGLALGVVSVLGAAAMYLGSTDQTLAGWAFAVAVTAAGLAIAAVHVYSE
jgi:hypothetical protein